MKHELHTEIDIEAPPTDVWAILTDLDAYADWNPFVVSSSGTVAVGERLSNRMQPPGGKAMNFSPTVTVVNRLVRSSGSATSGFRASSTVATGSNSPRRRRGPTSPTPNTSAASSCAS